MNQTNYDPERYDDDGPRPRRAPSFFWPILLIGAGIIILLVNVGVIPRLSWWSVLQLWPLLLIIAGLDLLIGRRYPAVGALLGVLVVGGAVALLVLGPSLGWTTAGEAPRIPGIGLPLGNQEVTRDTFSEPVGGARSARIEMDLGVNHTEVHPVASAQNLIEASLDHVRPIRFDVSGQDPKRVVLDEEPGGVFFPPFFGGRDLRWDIGLNTDVPLDLLVDASSGSLDMNLAEMDLTQLELQGSSGSAQVSLPATRHQVRFDASSGSATFDIASEAETTFRLDMSSGSVTLNVGDDAALNFELAGASSGSLTIRVPRNAALQVAVRDHSSGSVNLPSELRKVQQGGDEDEGTWESEGFASASRRITIAVNDVSSGSINVAYR